MTNIPPFREFRERHGLSQRELGVGVGLPQGVAQCRVSHWETGRRNLPRDLAYAFIDYAKQYGEAFTLEDLFPRPKSVPKVRTDRLQSAIAPGEAA